VIKVSRKTRARRKARKVRPKLVIAPSKEPWGSGAELTPQEYARVLSRYSNMRGRGFRLGFVFPFRRVNARTPEELEQAVRQELIADAKDKPQN
jgi:hypothetical protein